VQVRRLLGRQHWQLAVTSSLVLLAFATFAVSTQPNSGAADAEQYGVYSAYLEQDASGQSHGSKHFEPQLILIGDESRMVSEPATFRRWWLTVGSFAVLQGRKDHPRGSLIFNLIVANIQTHKLARRFHLSARYELIDLGKLSDPGFQDRYPNSHGHYQFSSVAFDPRLSEALFYTEQTCGPCYCKAFVLLRKLDGRWVIVRRYEISLS